MEGKFATYLEAPVRADIIVKAVQDAAIGPILAPGDFGLMPITAVHKPDYVEHLRTIYDRWLALGGPAEAAFPSIIPHQRHLSRFSPSPWAEIGYYSFDLSAPVTATTYEAALASAYCALTGVGHLMEGQRFVYALCRPPGHHATQDLMGGYCYFNNAAIAAQHIAGMGYRVAILDIDVHGGNGTQAIFYDRDDVLFISIHGAPEWEYPYFSGYADERGSGAGEGYTLNYPLEKGTDDAEYLQVIDHAMTDILNYEPDYLVLSAGFDTFKGDPLGKFELTTPCYHDIGSKIAALGLPVLVVQEGGYAVAALGENVVSLLRGLEAK